MGDRRVYLDYQATTPCDPRVVETMMPYFTDQFANAGSITHAAGREAAEVVQQSRLTIANFIGAEDRDLIFTSSATEANNLAIKGVAKHSDGKRNKIIVCAIDHPSVLNPAKSLREEGFQVELLKVDRSGKIVMSDLKGKFDDKTLMLSVCHGNSEIGSLQDLSALSDLCRQHGAFLHVDATQAALTEKINVEVLGIDLLSLSGHKIYGPKGIGVLYRRRKRPRVRMQTIMHGGDQEWGLRSGTLNVPAIVGMAKACEIIAEEQVHERLHLKSLRDQLKQGLSEIAPDMWCNSDESGLVQNLNVGVPGLQAQHLLCELESIQCSKGSSCSLDISKPSHVLLGIGLNADQADECLRFSIGRPTTKSDIEFVLAELKVYLEKTRVSQIAKRVVS